MKLYRSHSAKDFKIGMVNGVSYKKEFVNFDKHDYVSNDDRFVSGKHFCGMLGCQFNNSIILSIDNLIYNVEEGSLSVSEFDCNEFFGMSDQVFFELGKVKNLRKLSLVEIRELYKKNMS